MNKADCRLLGTLSKPHGYKGEVVLLAEANLPKDMTKWESVFVETDGLLVPFFLNSCVLTSTNSAIICFEELENIDLIRPYLHCNIYVPASLLKKRRKADNDWDDFKGYSVIDSTHGNIGTIEEVQDFNQNIVFCIRNQQQEIMIPVHESIITEINPAKKIVYIEAPEGLIELYKE